MSAATTRTMRSGAAPSGASARAPTLLTATPVCESGGVAPREPRKRGVAEDAARRVCAREGGSSEGEGPAPPAGARAMTDAEAAIGLATFAGQQDALAPERAKQTLTGELKLKLTRLRKLQLLLANPPPEVVEAAAARALASASSSSSDGDDEEAAADGAAADPTEDVVAAKQGEYMSMLASVCHGKAAKS